MKKKIGITYNLKSDWQPGKGDPVDANAELDTMETVDYIASALEAGGHSVVKIGNVKDLLDKSNNIDVDIVFNICEGLRGRNRESEVPVILEMLGIPFVGSDGLTLGVTLDKIVTKKMFMAEGIPTPRFFEGWAHEDLHELNQIGFPLFVKPRFEGTSKGLTKQSRVEDHTGLKRQIALINKNYNQGALVEEFIRGYEFTIPVLGNENPVAMPVVQIMIDGSTELGDKFFTFAHVIDPGDSVKYLLPARIDEELTRRLQELAIRAYKSVGCRDFGRVDIRVDEHGNPYVLEINPLPSLAKKDVYNLFPQIVGLTYKDIVNQILNYALQRYGQSAGKLLEIQSPYVYGTRLSTVGGK